MKQDKQVPVGKGFNMVEKIFEDILEGREARQNLSKLRAEIKQRFEREKVEDLIEQDNYLKLVALLDHEDAKTRKNAALFMGDMEMDSLDRKSTRLNSSHL